MSLMGVALALICIVETNPIRVNYCCIRHSFTATVVKSSCTRVTRQSASVIKMGVAYVNVCVSRRLKEEVAWAMINVLGLLVIKCCLNSYTTKKLKKKAV